MSAAVTADSAEQTNSRLKIVPLDSLARPERDGPLSMSIKSRGGKKRPIASRREGGEMGTGGKGRATGTDVNRRYSDSITVSNSRSYPGKKSGRGSFAECVTDFHDKMKPRYNGYVQRTVWQRNLLLKCARVFFWKNKRTDLEIRLQKMNDK
ncbi:hypothetical protein X777_02989 [Ooceraea biroi]|uniref:Uncharacterized protein n=1 Tax=Ooceraea biroi TaxID=2015173 RepID=A0A026WK25_OOCBI|nr:hypothetical protein X777_02989 [Ooceraea biroi]